MIKVIIAGGRDFKDYELLKKVCIFLLKDYTAVEIVSGTAKGADKLGEQFAKEMGHSIKLFPAPWDDIEDKNTFEVGINRIGKKYWKMAGHFRNGEMAEYADFLIAFWNGKSKGTKNMIGLMSPKNVLKIIQY